MDVLEQIQQDRQTAAAAARVSARRLVRFYSTVESAPSLSEQAAAGALARTVARSAFPDAFGELGALHTHWAAAATGAIEQWQTEARQRIELVCPLRHRSAAYEMVVLRAEAAQQSPDQPLVAPADRYGALHGDAAAVAALIATGTTDRQTALAELASDDERFRISEHLSAHLRDEWRRRVSMLRSWQAATEHDYMPVPDDAEEDLAAVMDDLRVLAPASPESAPADWPGGWLLRHGDRPIRMGARAAWPTEAEARAASGGLDEPVEVVWAPFASALGGTIVLDRQHWETASGGSELGA